MKLPKPNHQPIANAERQGALLLQLPLQSQTNAVNAGTNRGSR